MAIQLNSIVSDADSSTQYPQNPGTIGGTTIGGTAGEIGGGGTIGTIGGGGGGVPNPYPVPPIPGTSGGGLPGPSPVPVPVPVPVPIIDITPIPPKSGRLRDYAVYYNDMLPMSRFFNIKKLPLVLTAGKNYILLSGTDLLQPTTNVAIEILDVKGNRLPMYIPDILINGTDRMVVITVRSGVDYYGMANITILGEAIDVPRQWKHVYNVKWSYNVLCNPSLDNDDDVIFVSDPDVTIDEYYDTTGSISTVKYIPMTMSAGTISSRIGGSEMSPMSKYYIDLNHDIISNPTEIFTTDMEKGILYISESNMNIYPNGQYYYSSSYQTYVLSVINNKTLLANNSYQAVRNDGRTDILERVTFMSSSYSISYKKRVVSGSNIIKNSYLNINFKNLNTYVGSLRYVDLYKNPGNQYIGRYTITPHEMLTSGSKFSSSSDFTNNWTYVMSGSYSHVDPNVISAREKQRLHLS